MDYGLSVADMEINKQIEELFEVLNNSDLPNKEDLKRETVCGINTFIDYFNTVVSEQIYYSSTNF